MTNKLDLSVKQDDHIFHKQLVNIHEFYLSGEIESPENYIQWFDIIRHAGETDLIKIYINSPGGDTFTAVQFMRALKETSAQVTVSVEGICASAATMIMLSADNFEVSEHSTFLFHDYSGAVLGKSGEMYDQLNHARTWSEKLLTDVYGDFLTTEEIKSMLDNKDIWMDGDEVIKRLTERQKIIDAKSTIDE